MAQSNKLSDCRWWKGTRNQDREDGAWNLAFTSASPLLRAAQKIDAQTESIVVMGSGCASPLGAALSGNQTLQRAPSRFVGIGSATHVYHILADELPVTDAHDPPIKVSFTGLVFRGPLVIAY